MQAMGAHSASEDVREHEATTQPGSSAADQGCSRGRSPSFDKSRRQFEVITWNIAAVNNNPFEYWVTHDDPAYNKLMSDAQEFIDCPNERDVKICDIFTDEMFETLALDLRQAGFPDSDVREVEHLWGTEYRNRQAVAEFLKDKKIGAKRLASMPDRITNTINTHSGEILLRPAVINCFKGELSSISSWWSQWRQFMFQTKVEVINEESKGEQVVFNLLEPILQTKYPAITEKEQAISIPLQIMCLAIFDVVMVHMLNTVACDTWQGLRESLCTALHSEKDAQVSRILDETYYSAKVVFIQEAAAAFVDRVLAHPSLSNRYMVLHPPQLDGKRDQNSIILADKSWFDEDSATDITPEILAGVTNWPTAPGDLVAVSVKCRHDGKKYLLASFHGDTNGLATLIMVRAVHKTATETHGDHLMIFGLDANTYKVHNDQYQGVENFQENIAAMGMGSCWGDRPNPNSSTTCNARTYLQPQLNKAVGLKEKIEKADKNLKDWIVFFSGQAASSMAKKDNTGKRVYVSDMIFPTLTFPSDHAVVSAVLSMRGDENGGGVGEQDNRTNTGQSDS